LLLLLLLLSDCWLAGWLAGWLASWLAGCLAGWLVAGCLIVGWGMLVAISGKSGTSKRSKAW